MATVSNSGKFGNGSGPWYQRSGETGPPWQIVLFVALGGLGFFTILEFQSFLTKHLHSYHTYDTYIFLTLLVSGVAGAVYFYHTSRQAWQGTVEMVKSLTVTGTPTQCRARVEEYVKAGVQTPILVPVGKNQKEGIKAAIKAFTS